MITAQNLYNESKKQQVTHRKSWEQIDDGERFKYEAYAEWANALFAEQEKELKDLLMSVNSKATWIVNRFKLPDGCVEEIDEIVRITSKFRNG